ncbi:MAG: hypothetical protein KDA93_13690 [Planctomycetaceae bacterium]|nr:hypothetical protein [Planctomycetaceae bacterium]
MIVTFVYLVGQEFRPFRPLLSGQLTLVDVRVNQRGDEPLLPPPIV